MDKRCHLQASGHLDAWRQLRELVRLAGLPLAVPLLLTLLLLRNHQELAGLPLALPLILALLLLRNHQESNPVLLRYYARHYLVLVIFSNLNLSVKS